ncbi:heterokaryon incompatibility protein-domain-containing protein [Lineolata rhizophorae]|uniref:Heterokaryon incompatibility protein-domain-containing protein n=1 Tax=Lineolata rhizophorae TaxID=578093 RepID=A0A6A6NYY0_9PEZI|nr:heterokaryon incompatibility protein-domain-containing protein [Lineolata rhizophorae]
MAKFSGAHSRTEFSTTCETLCDRCSSLDLDDVFGSASRPRRGRSVCRIGKEIETSSCSLCRLVFALRPSQDASDKDNGGPSGQGPLNDANSAYDLCTFSAFQVFGWNKRISDDLEDTILLGVVPVGWPKTEQSTLAELSSRGFIAAVSEHDIDSRFTVRRLSADAIDWDVVSSWLHYCLENHLRHCAKVPHASIKDLRLIDCLDRQIVTLSQEEQFVALSYVWGSVSAPKSTGSSHQENDLPEVPEVVEDAIEVTKNLGYRYLWVDRYCIDQRSHEMKHSQIQQMHLVYSKAQFTIVMAAGEDASYGLPGIRGKRRKEQPMGKAFGRLLVSTLPDPCADIRRSKWASRGWTFQEGLLSRRRLVFTDWQVYFECIGMNCAEVASKPLDLLHIKDKGRMQSSAIAENSRILPLKGIVSSPLAINDFITEYTTRQMTYNSDILNGMLGILQTVRGSRWLVSHLQGVPVAAPYVYPLTGNFVKIRRSLLEGFLTNLCWNPVRPSRRRKGFPSWSWTGWFGPVSFTETSAGRGVGFDIEVDLERKSGELVSWAQYEADCDSERDIFHMPLFIHVQAWTLQLRLRPFKGGKVFDGASATSFVGDFWGVSTDLSSGDEYCIPAKLTKDPSEHEKFKEKLSLELWDGIIIGSQNFNKPHARAEPRGPAVLIVEHLEGGVTERVGLLDLAAPLLHCFPEPSGFSYRKTMLESNNLSSLLANRTWRKIRLG